MPTECFECKGLTPLIELAKEPSYHGPKIVLCDKHLQAVVDQINETV